ncbi:MAG: DUF3109 family protein [Saprospiraceae bacterium]
MIAIQDKLISEEVLKSYFACELNACKGACCWEGDFGAPLHKDELSMLDKITGSVIQYLPEESVKVLRKEPGYEWNEDTETFVTKLRKNASCIYMITGEDGIAQCGIERAWKNGESEFRKPISCHLYPIRVKEKSELGFTALNYDRWSICSAACQSGKKIRMPLFKFVKDALIRRFGEEFYLELEAVAKELYPAINP